MNDMAGCETAAELLAVIFGVDLVAPRWASQPRPGQSDSHRRASSREQISDLLGITFVELTLPPRTWWTQSDRISCESENQIASCTHRPGLFVIDFVVRRIDILGVVNPIGDGIMMTMESTIVDKAMASHRVHCRQETPPPVWKSLSLVLMCGRI
jgi:hypothetical protein